MFNKLIKEKNNLIILTFIFITYVFISYLKSVNSLSDIGREIYIPWQMLEGKLLYKDLLNIFGPLAYQFNALIMSIFGVKFSVLNVAGFINSYIILITTYFISSEFLNKKFSLLISIFIIIAAIFQYSNFNYNLTYSYSMVYGLNFYLLSILCLIKYFKNNIIDKSNFLLYCASFCLGISVACKYDFIPFVFFVFVLFLYKKIKFKVILKCALLFLLPIIFSYSILLIQGVSFQDLYNAFLLTNKMAHAKSIKTFYCTTTGMFLDKAGLNKLLFNMFSWIIVFINFYFMLFFNDLINKKLKKYKLLSLSLKIFMIFLFCFLVSSILNIKYPYFAYFMTVEGILNTTYSLFIKLKTILLALKTPILLNITIFAYSVKFNSLPTLMIILFILKFKQLKNNIPFLILLSATLVSLIKVFYKMHIGCYTAFALPLFCITFVYLLTNLSIKYFKKQYIEKIIISFIVLFSFVFSINNIKFFLDTNCLIDFNNIKIYTTCRDGKLIQEEVYQISKLTNKNDTVIIMPEGHILNLLSNRKSDDFYHTFVPSHTDFLEEDKIIEHFKYKMPKLIVINNRTTKDYGPEYLCKDYGKKICSWVKENYEIKSIVNKDEPKIEYINYIRKKN